MTHKFTSLRSISVLIAKFFVSRPLKVNMPNTYAVREKLEKVTKQNIIMKPTPLNKGHILKKSK